MFPDLFSIGPLIIHTYGLFMAAGFFVGIIVTLKIGKLEGISPQQIMDMGFIIILSAIVGSRLLYVLLNITYYSHEPVEIFKMWRGGLVFSGGIIGVIMAMFRYSERRNLSLWKIGDLWAPAAAVGQAIGRIGCFMAGCCYGKPTDLKWGVVFTYPNSLAPINISLHPTQIYSSILGFIIFFILLIIRSKKKFEGQVFLWFLILHSTARLAIERFRGDDRGMLLNSNMSITQFVTIFILIASVVALMVLKSKGSKQSEIQ
ncbi:MAG: prolipoprotein diacylglyceryl transferase [Deltaproteobacteria bacterium]|nr:prolipoprotein diacylglyceryl transferase [Deltaproteobacteria bacterium]MBW2033411.1 prolipoprotein diacylglyceryl transferase [Deltaproteobacteria bacterium]